MMKRFRSVVVAAGLAGVGVAGVGAAHALPYKTACHDAAGGHLCVLYSSAGGSGREDDVVYAENGSAAAAVAEQQVTSPGGDYQRSRYAAVVAGGATAVAAVNNDQSGPSKQTNAGAAVGAGPAVEGAAAGVTDRGCGAALIGTVIVQAVPCPAGVKPPVVAVPYAPIP